MNAVQLAWRVLRFDRRTRTSALLTAGGVAVATALISLLVSLPYTTQARAERVAWQQPAGMVPEQEAGALVSVSEDYFHDRKITKVDVAALRDDATTRLPDGVPEFPGPGEVLLSPALSELVQEHPRDRLRDRYPGTGVGTLGEQALSWPGQLVALVGHSESEMPADAVAVPTLDNGYAMSDGILALLAGVGVVVLLVPSLVLVASASRLTAARRERRLAALRLAGASPAHVVGAVTAETSIAACAGAVTGVLLGWPMRHLATLVPWQGGGWLADDFTLPIAASLLIAVTIPLLVVLAAAVGLRRVVSAPLGAAAAHRRAAPKAWRLIAIPVAGVGFAFGLSVAREEGSIIMLLCGLALVLLSASVVGPWVTSAVGALFVRTWRRPATLLAGRRLRADPKAAYRSAAGVVLAVFTGSMALTLLPSFEAKAGGGRSFQDSVLYVSTNAERAEQIVQRTNETLREYGQPATASTVGTVRLGTRNDAGEKALVLDCSSAAKLTRIEVASSCAGKPGVWSTVPLPRESLRVKPVSTLPPGVSVPDRTGSPGHSGNPEGSGNPEDTDSARLPAGTPVHQVDAASELPSAKAIVDPALVPERMFGSDVSVVLPTTPENRETVRSALVNAASGAQVLSRELHLHDQQTQLADLRRVTVIGLLTAAALAGASAAISAAGAVLDRRRTFGALMAAGTPLRVLSRALRTEAALPAMVATVGAGAGGVFVGLALFSLFEGELRLSPWVLAPAVLGVLVAVLAASASAPALRRVRNEPLVDE